MKIDLHVHTYFSDGVDSPEKMIRWAKKVGLDGVAITDHNTIGGWKRALNEGKRIGIKIITGKEIKIKENKKTIGEILALFLEEDVKGNEVSELSNIVDKIKAQDGILAIAHPFENRLKFTKYPIDSLPFFPNKSKLLRIIEENGIKLDAIEIMNGRSYEVVNKRSEKYAKLKRIAGIAGSDAHWVYEIGKFYTVANANDLEEFRKEIKNGKVKVYGKNNFFEIQFHRVACKIGRIINRI